MNKSTHIISILLSPLLFFFSCQAAKVKNDKYNQQVENISQLSTEPIPLEVIPYENWPENRKVVYSGFLSEKQDYETILNIQDERQSIDQLPLKILPNKGHTDIVNYVVKLYSYCGSVNNKAIEGEGTATIIRAKDGIVYLLTCAHNVVKYKSVSNKNNENYPNNNHIYTKHFAKSICFYYKGVKYPCKSYYVHPQYNRNNKNKDIAIVVSHRGNDLSFPYSFFPNIASVSGITSYKGYVIGFPGDKGDSKEKIYGMSGDLIVTPYAIQYNNIDTSNGQSGSAIWAEIGGFYKIIGVHTVGNELYNCGPFLSKDIIAWEKLCWIKAQEAYHKHQNIFNQNIDIRKFLETPALDINKKYKNGVTLFLLAAKRGNLNTLKKLKEKGANLHDIDHDGKNALDYAIQYTKNAELIKWLIDIGQFPVVPKKKDDQLKLLVSAVKYDNLSALKVLAQKGINLHVKDQNGKNLLHYVVKYTMNLKILNWFTHKAKIPVNDKSLWFYGETPFLIAAQQGNLAFLKALKEQGANLHATDKYGYNAVHFAIENKVEYKVIKWLINVAKVDINAKRGYYQKTPFLCAAEKGNLPVLKTLKKKGVNLHITDKEGKNALHLAVIFSQNREVIEWLIGTAYIPIESTAPTRFNDDELTPFLWAAKHGNLPALKALKQKKANIYAEDKRKKNALWYASQYSNNQEAISWLQNKCKLTSTLKKLAESKK